MQIFQLNASRPKNPLLVSISAHVTSCRLTFTLPAMLSTSRLPGLEPLVLRLFPQVAGLLIISYRVLPLCFTI